MNTEYAYIEQNLRAVREEISAAEQAAEREGRTSLIAAIKYADDAEVAELLRLGVRAVGENRVQQLLAHYPTLESGNAEIHFIGSLQKNKVKYIVDKVAMIHSVDTAELAAEIERRAARCGITVKVLAEVNIGREPAKSGAMPEDITALCREILSCPHLSLCGLMTMAPRSESEREYRAYFGQTRELARTVWQTLALEGEPILSMGMSESFGAAIAEGADLVRVGRRLFSKSGDAPPVTPQQEEVKHENT
ncbi:MAG: YggS family pyridoxal phosphate-dependent enzyme [Ruminococcaceae bacterium]|nr:YggS family pyridoxal phosphate-dependent enzyme [Oscillospiraceae bacterium]